MQVSHSGWRVVMPALWAFAFLRPAHAQLAVAPRIAETQASAGGVTEMAFTASNKEPDPLDVTINLYGLTVTPDGRPEAMADAPRNCAEWLAVEPTKFQLPPGESRSIKARLTVPANAQGGYYAVMSCFGKPMVGDDAAGTGGTRAAVRFSFQTLSIVMLTVPGRDLKAVLEPQPPLLAARGDNQGLELRLPVRNTGNLHAQVMGDVELRSDAGQLVQQFEIRSGSGFILPEQERLFVNTATVLLPDGVYIAKVRLLVRGSTKPMEHSFPFYIREGRPGEAEITDALRRQLEVGSTGFTVSPAELGVPLPAGARKTAPVEVANLTKDTITVTAEVFAWRRDAEGRDAFTPEAPDTPRSVAAMLSLPRSEFELRPLARARVPVLVTLPKDATGEYYAAVVFNRAGRDVAESDADRLRRTVLIPIYASKTGQPAAEIKDFTVEEQPSGARLYTLRYANTGNVSLIPEVSLRVTNEAGEEVGRARPVREVRLCQAGCDQILHFLWDTILPPGNYRAQVTFRAVGDVPMESKLLPFTIAERPVGGGGPAATEEGAP